MKSVINDLFPGESRAQRRRTLVSESSERLFTPLSQIWDLQDLGKTPQRVLCPYCKQTARTRVRRSDSSTTKTVNALLWMGFADPFALASYDWCQNTDHFCTRCNGHLVR